MNFLEALIFQISKTYTSSSSARQSSPFRSLGSREEFVAIGNDPEDEEDDDEIDSGSTDSIARDHNYIPFSRGGGSSRRLNLSSSSNEGPSRNDRNSRMTFMETFFLRRSKIFGGQMSINFVLINMLELYFF